MQLTARGNEVLEPVCGDTLGKATGGCVVVDNDRRHMDASGVHLRTEEGGKESEMKSEWDTFAEDEME